MALGTLHIDMVIENATADELANLGVEWQSGIVREKIKARQVQLWGETKPMVDWIDHEIKLTKNITIPPRKALKTMGMVKLPVLSKRLNVTAEPLENIGHFNGVHSIESYGTVKTGTKRIAVGLVNDSGDKVTIKKGTVVRQLKATNVVPPALASQMSTDEKVLEYASKYGPKCNVLKYETMSMSMDLMQANCHLNHN